MTNQIKANVLKSFIDKATVNGLVEDCKIVFGDDGILMRHKDLPGVIFVEALLTTDAFEQYEAGVSINVKNSKTLSNVLKTFGDSILQITVEKGQALFQTENGGYQLTLAEQVVCHKDAVPPLEYDNELIIPASQFDLIVNRNKIVNHDTVYVNVAEQKINLKVGKESDSADVVIATDNKGTYKTQFDSKYFEQVVSVFDDVVIASLDNQKPSKFVEKTNASSVTVFLSKLQDSQAGL